MIAFQLHWHHIWFCYSVGFPGLEPVILTATLKHHFEALGGNIVQITFEDTEVQVTGGIGGLLVSLANTEQTPICLLFTKPHFACTNFASLSPHLSLMTACVTHSLTVQARQS